MFPLLSLIFKHWLKDNLAKIEKLFIYIGEENIKNFINILFKMELIITLPVLTLMIRIEI